MHPASAESFIQEFEKGREIDRLRHEVSAACIHTSCFIIIEYIRSGSDDRHLRVDFPYGPGYLNPIHPRQLYIHKHLGNI